MYLRTYGSFKSENHSKDWVRYICGRSANLTNYLSQKVCGFSLRRTYLRTAHFWYYVKH